MAMNAFFSDHEFDGYIADGSYLRRSEGKSITIEPSSIGDTRLRDSTKYPVGFTIAGTVLFSAAVWTALILLVI